MPIKCVRKPGGSLLKDRTIQKGMHYQVEQYRELGRPVKYSKDITLVRLPPLLPYQETGKIAVRSLLLSGAFTLPLSHHRHSPPRSCKTLSIPPRSEKKNEVRCWTKRQITCKCEHLNGKSTVLPLWNRIISKYMYTKVLR